jgi:hypothetical protein
MHDAAATTAPQPNAPAHAAAPHLVLLRRRAPGLLVLVFLPHVGVHCWPDAHWVCTQVLEGRGLSITPPSVPVPQQEISFLSSFDSRAAVLLVAQGVNEPGNVAPLCTAELGGFRESSSAEVAQTFRSKGAAAEGFRRLVKT